jgi:membrane protein
VPPRSASERARPGSAVTTAPIRGSRREQTLTRIDVRAAERRLEKTFLGRCLRGLLAFQALDRAMAISAQAFTALIPLLILAGALAPADDVVADALIGKFRLGGDAAAAVRQVFAHPAGASTGVLSVVLLVFSGVSLTRRLQRMYQEAWGLPRTKGLRNSINALLGLATLVIELALLYFARSLIRPLPTGWVLGVPLSAVGAVLLWTSIPWLLLDRRLRWTRLLPAGVLTAACTSGYGVATAVYMPHLFETYSARYGLFGVTLALVGWLLCMAVIVVAATVVAAEFDRAPEPWARQLRARFRAVFGGPSRSEGDPSSAPSSG